MIFVELRLDVNSNSQIVNQNAVLLEKPINLK